MVRRIASSPRHHQHEVGGSLKPQASLQRSHERASREDRSILNPHVSALRPTFNYAPRFSIREDQPSTKWPLLDGFLLNPSRSRIFFQILRALLYKPHKAPPLQRATNFMLVVSG